MKLANGFEVDIRQDVLDDMEVIEILAEVIEKEKATGIEAILSMAKIGRMLELMMGKENKNRMYQHIREKEGSLKVEVVSGCVTEICAKLGEAGKKP